MGSEMCIRDSNYTSTKNQSMGCTCIYLETDNILFHSQIVRLIFVLSIFVQNKIKVIIPMTLRENAISVCVGFFKSTFFNTNFSSPLFMQILAIDVSFYFQSVVLY